MTPRLLVALWALTAAAPLAAQNGVEHFKAPPRDTALDPAHAVQRDAFLILRDSTAAISAAGSKLMSDLTSSSSLVWMRTRARAVATACTRTVSPLANAQAVTEAAAWPKAGQQKAQAELLKEMKRFSGDLVDCQKRWTTMAADTSQVAVRESAPYQMKRLSDSLAQFDRAARKYLQYISITLPPPVASTS